MAQTRRTHLKGLLGGAALAACGEVPTQKLPSTSPFAFSCFAERGDIYYQTAFSELWSVRSNGTNPIKLTTAKPLVALLDLSFSGCGLAYVARSENERYELRVVNTDGSNDRSVVEFTNLDISATFSQENLLAYHIKRTVPQCSPTLESCIDSAMYVSSVAIKSTKEVPSKHSVNPVWSPQKELLAFLVGRVGEDVKAGDVAIYDAKTGLVTLLTEGLLVKEIVWSPDGKKLAYVHSSKDLSQSDEIYILDQRDESTKKISIASYNVSNLEWSADAENIVFHAKPLLEEDDEKYPQGVFVLSVPNDAITRIAKTQRIISPHWSPTGSHVIYDTASDDEIPEFARRLGITSSNSLYVCSKEGGEAQRLTNPKGNIPDISVNPLRFRQDGDFIYLGIRFDESGNGRSDLFIVNAFDGTTPRQLTNNGNVGIRYFGTL